MSAEFSFDRMMSLIKEGREKAYQEFAATLMERVSTLPSGDFTVFGPDLHMMTYIRDRFIQDGFTASMTTRDGEEIHDVTVHLCKHLPALPCLCGCKSLSGHVKPVETPANGQVRKEGLAYTGRTYGDGLYFSMYPKGH